MALDFSRIQFPWEMFQQAQQAQNQNQQQMFQNVQGIGQGLGEIGKNIEQQRARDALQKALLAMRGPQQNPVTAGVEGAMNPSQPAPQPMDPYSLMMLGHQAYGDKNPFDLTKQSEFVKNLAQAKKDSAYSGSEPMYSADAAEAALNGDVQKFASITGNKPIDQRALNIMSTGRGREKLDERSRAYLDARIDKNVLDYTQALETNPLLSKMRDQELGIEQVGGMIALVRTGNTVAASAMGVKMAKAMGEVGVLTENDVKRYVLSKKISQAAADKLRGWTQGVPSEATLDEVQQISDVLKGTMDKKVQPIYDRYVHRLARNFNMSEEEAARRLDVPYGGLTGAKVAAEVNNNAEDDMSTMSKEELEGIAARGRR